MPKISEIENLTNRLIEQMNVQRAPIPIREIATGLGLEVIRHPDAGLSGILVVHGSQGTIGYNPNDSPVRQRFTIAHELGHYFLHVDQQPIAKNIFIDKTFSIQVEYRKESGDYENQRAELEANAFAAALLMPRAFLVQEFRNYTDLGEMQVIKKLAAKFQVSSIAMAYRISNLQLLRVDLDDL